MKAYWFTVREQGGVALGSCDLSLLHVGGEWQWLVRQDGRDVAEGAAASVDDARREAETTALRLLDPTPVNYGKPGRAGGFHPTPASSKTG